MSTEITNSKKSSDILKAAFALIVFIVIIFLSAKAKDDQLSLKSEDASIEQSGEYYYELGKMYDYAGDRELAYANLNKAVSLLPQKHPKLLPTYVLLARLAFQPDEHPSEKDKQEIKKYILLLTNPENTKTEQAWGHALQAELYHMEDNQEEAIFTAKRAVALDPENATMQHVLGEALLEGHKDGKEIYYTNFLNEAIVAFEKNLETQKQAHSYYLLGVAYWYKGEKNKAKELWQTGLEIIPSDPYYPMWYKTVLKKEIEEVLEHPEELDEMRH
jgi:tetratricopeptide (TPR) repeat protein